MRALSVGAVGTLVTTSSSSSATAIPNDSNGTRARWVRLQALTACHVRPGFSGTTATTGDMLLSADDAVLLDVRAYTHIAAIENATGAKFVITPLDSAP